MLLQQEKKEEEVVVPAKRRSSLEAIKETIASMFEKDPSPTKGSGNTPVFLAWLGLAGVVVADKSFSLSKGVTSGSVSGMAAGMKEAGGELAGGVKGAGSGVAGGVTNAGSAAKRGSVKE